MSFCCRMIRVSRPPPTPATDIGEPQGADPSHLPLRVAKTGKNHYNKEITPLLPTGIGERF